MERGAAEPNRNVDGKEPEYMDVATWQKRLEQNFSVNGVVGGHLLEIIDMEKAYGEFVVKTFHGQSVLIDSFLSFYIETIQTAQAWINTNGWPRNAPNYAPIYLFYVINFRSFRACENLLTCGYPLDGYALLRDIKDRAIFLAAVAQNITTFPRVYGYVDIKEASEEAWESSRKKRKDEEHRVLRRMIRADSGLPNDIRKHLTKWEQLFHEEVHGSRCTYFAEGGEWMRGEGSLSVGPTPKANSIVMYTNRSSEIGWLLVRLLPFLQPVEKAFGESWIQRQMTLDDSFRIMIKGLSKLGKPIADAFTYFVEDKFKFPDTFHYFEADGSS